MKVLNFDPSLCTGSSRAGADSEAELAVEVVEAMMAENSEDRQSIRMKMIKEKDKTSPE